MPLPRRDQTSPNEVALPVGEQWARIAVGALIVLGAFGFPYIAGERPWAVVAAAVDVPARLFIVWAMSMAWQRNRRAPEGGLLLLLAGSVLLDLLSALFFRTAVLGANEAALPFGDVAQLLSYGFVVVGVLMLPHTSQWRSPATTVLDVAVTVGGFGLVVWFYLIRPAPQYGGYGAWLGAATELAYPLLDAALLISVLARFRGGLSRLVPEARRALVVAAVAIFVGDGFIGIAFYVARAPWTGYAASLCHGISLLALLMLAQTYRRAPSGLSADAGDGSELPLSPVSAAALTMALLAMGREALVGRTNLTLVAGAAGLGLLLVVRQLLGVRTNNRWLR